MALRHLVLMFIINCGVCYGRSDVCDMYLHQDYTKPFMSMDTLGRGTLIKGADGISYFEMHLAAIAAKDNNSYPKPAAYIVLSSTSSPKLKSELNYEISISQYSVALFKKRTQIGLEGNGTDMLSESQYKMYYIKIKEGRLEIGLKGSSPLITYNDPDFKKLKYISFGSPSADTTSSVEIFYNCSPYATSPI